MQRRNLALLPLLFILGCGGGDAPAAPSKPAPPAAKPGSSSDGPPAAAASSSSTASSGPQTWDGSQGVAEVAGVVNFSGTAPVRAALDMGSDPVCHEGGEHLDETVIVNDGKLQNVFVYVTKGLDDWEFEAPSEPVVLNQKGCVYIPHVVGIQKGQTLKVTNEDNVTHNVHTYSRKNSSFNKSQPAGAAPIEQEFKRDEKQFAVKCDIHSWMSAFITVVEHPFFAVSDASGAFSLGSLPPGDYRITAEHETLGKQTAEVTVAAGGVDPIVFTFGGEG